MYKDLLTGLDSRDAETRIDIEVQKLVEKGEKVSGSDLYDLCVLNRMRDSHKEKGKNL